MLNAKNPYPEVNLINKFQKNKFDLLLFLKDKVLLYIDEQICSRLTGSAKKNCKEIIEKNGKDLINNIDCETVRRKILITIFYF